MITFFFAYFDSCANSNGLFYVVLKSHCYILKITNILHSLFASLLKILDTANQTTFVTVFNKGSISIPYNYYFKHFEGSETLLYDNFLEFINFQNFKNLFY